MALNVVRMLVVSQLPCKINSSPLQFPSQQLFEIWALWELIVCSRYSPVATPQIIPNLKLFCTNPVTSQLMGVILGQQKMNSGRK